MNFLQQAEKEPAADAKPPERCIAYVDGFNLYFGLTEANLKRFLWLDVVEFAKSFCHNGQVLVATKYFTSRITGALSGDSAETARRRNDKRRRQKTYLQALETTNGIEIIEGQFYSNRTSCFRCNGVWLDQQEKMTDVNIATHLLVDAYTNSFDTAFVVSGDSDLSPPVRAIKTLFPEKKVVVYFPPRRTSAQLIKAASHALHVSEENLKHQLPDPIVINGYSVAKPPQWK